MPSNIVTKYTNAVFLHDAKAKFMELLDLCFCFCTYSSKYDYIISNFYVWLSIRVHHGFTVETNNENFTSMY